VGLAAFGASSSAPPSAQQVHHGSEQNDDPEQEPYKQDPSQGLACEVRKEVC
jgi:hypothetical protein